MDEANTILSGVPDNRLADLAARVKAGHLTPLEALALCILKGGPDLVTVASKLWRNVEWYGPIPEPQ